jgi:sucrose-phosphate synthase
MEKSPPEAGRKRTKSGHIDTSDGYYVLLISVHGLIRGTEMELGRDADTGGQVQYVVELARGLARHPDVGRVDLVTRQVEDAKVSKDYARPLETLAPGAHIVRVPCGRRRYLRKETLWPYLGNFTDNLIKYLRSQRRVPDVVHAHYADAAWVGSTLAGLLDVPLVFTGHSLGREKRRRLLERGMKPETIESRYRITRRIEAEETALDHAAFVVASTHQEVQKQYQIYDNYNPKRMIVIPPGIDPGRFGKVDMRGRYRPPIAEQVERFLADPRKPILLALARPDPKKNLESLVRAFGERASLREKANLVLVAGNRTDIRDLDREPQKVWSDLLLLIDRYDLYGHVAYPKCHRPEDVPDLYKMAASTYGVFVNPALTEPFGLTLIEAAASGLPIVATQDGGPRDIVANCKNGLLVDPVDIEKLGRAMESALDDRDRWKKWSRSGVAGVERHYTWDGHVRKYLQGVQRVCVRHERRQREGIRIRKRLLTLDRFVLADVDDTLTGNAEGVKRLLEVLEAAGPNVGFGVATGRSLKLTVQALKKWNIPMLDLLITSVGTEIYYGPNLTEDLGWIRQIRYRWHREAVRRALDELPGLKLQGKEGQGAYKVSYFYDPEKAPSREEIVRYLRKKDLPVRVIVSHGMFLDAVPIRASKGQAARYFALKWNIPFDHLLVAGDCGNDEDMLTGNTLGVVVANHEKEIAHLRDHPRIYFAEKDHAWGVLEGIEHYDFLGDLVFEEPDVDLDHRDETEEDASTFDGPAEPSHSSKSETR